LTPAALLLLIAVAASTDTTTAVVAADAPVRLFFETGLLMGGESDVATYEASAFRIHSEVGFEFRGRELGRDIGRRLGIAGTASIGQDDLRLGVGPRLTWRFHPDWAWQFLTGPVWSSEEDESGLFDMGLQARAGVIYRDTASLTVLWQNLPYGKAYETASHGSHNSLYGGVMLHSRSGTILSTLVWGALVAVMVAYLAGGAGS